MQDVHTCTRRGRAVDDRPDPLDVGIPTALGAPVGVADAHAERRLLAAHLTNRCHRQPHLVIQGRRGLSRQAVTGPTQVSIPAMQTLERLTAGDLVAVVTAYRDALRAHQDSSTGSTSTRCPTATPGPTWRSPSSRSCEELADRAIRRTDMASVAKAISYGSLMGARGNSGVILSQILRGLADVGPAHRWDRCRGAGRRAGPGGRRRLPGRAESGGRNDPDRRPGRRPTRRPPARPTAGLVAVLEAARHGAGDALARTPDLLPVLKSAGVVEPVEPGWCCCSTPSFTWPTAGPCPCPEAPEPAAGVEAGLAAHRAGPGQRADPAGLRYEVMYLLEAPDEPIPPFREVWAGIGDSIVVVGGDGLWNCHIHTDDIGARHRGGARGGTAPPDPGHRPLEQVEEERWVRDAAGPTAGRRAASEPPVRCAVVAVCTGEGIRRIFRSLGRSPRGQRRPVDEPVDRRPAGRHRRRPGRAGCASSPTTRTSSRSPSRPQLSRRSPSG